LSSKHHDDGMTLARKIRKLVLAGQSAELPPLSVEQAILDQLKLQESANKEQAREQARAHNHVKLSKRRRGWRLVPPSDLENGIALINSLRTEAVPSPDAQALQELDDLCSRALLDWWSDNLGVAPPYWKSPVSTSPRLSAGEALVIGAVWVRVTEARYPDNPKRDDLALLLDCAKRDELRKLGITGPLAKLVVTLQKKPEWCGRVRRCLYMLRQGRVSARADA
jgi:hypothetical protein